MLRVGLTGNIGSGKSTVAKLFTLLGIQVYHADERSKSFLGDPAVIRAVVEKFGSSVLNEDGSVNRKSLAAVVFSDAASLSALNNILHPLVMEDFLSWAEAQEGSPYLVHEAAVLYESGFESAFDKIIHVSCPQQEAINRIIRRDKAKREDILKRMQFQWKDEKKAALANFVIHNDGIDLVIPQVLEIHRQLVGSPA